MSDLREALDRLGLSHYLGRLIDEGFDRWETVLDIQEADLAYMGFKLGHRRVLQRAIARERGVPENEPIPWLYQQPYTEDTGDEPDDKSSPRGFRPDYKGAVQTKRKYRRHPRPDENAPEKPPSAYVMFANHVREELKGQNLSFTEIARLVGEKWKVLDPDQKEEYEYQATTMKERYNQELAAYKKTDNYKEYAQYLQEFKTKEAAKEAGEASFTPTPDVPRKRPKLESIPSQGSAHSSLPGSSASGISVGGGPTPVPSSSRPHQQQHPGESPSYPQPATIAAGHYAQHGRRDSYASPFTQPSTPASQLVSPINFSESSTGSTHAIRQYPPGAGPNSYEREAVTLPYRNSPGRSTHMYYDQSRPPHEGGHAEGFEPQGMMMLPKINAQPLRQVLSYSRGQPSPEDSPSQHPRRSGSISGMSYQHQQQRPALHSSDTLSTQNSISSSGSSSVPSLTPATPSDGDGRQPHGRTLRALPPLRNPSPSQRGSSSYFTQRPTREVSGGVAGNVGGGGGGNSGYPGHGSTSSSPRGQLPSLAEQTMQDQPPRRSGDVVDHS